MLTYVVDLTYIKSLNDIDAQLPAHREWLKKGYQSGLVLISGPKEPRTGGIILARTSNIEILLNYLAEDPFNKIEAIKTKITPFTAMDVK